MFFCASTNYCGYLNDDSSQDKSLLKVLFMKKEIQ